MTWKALILAAGQGTRLAPYTDITPKPMFTLAGKPLLYHWIKRLVKAGCHEVFINVHHLHGQIEAYIADNRWSVPVATVFERELLGTGGAVRNIAPRWQTGDLMVINSDVVCPYDLSALLEWHRANRHDVSLLLTDCPTFNMVATTPEGGVSAFDAKDDPAARTFTGLQVLTPAVLDYLPATGFYHSIDAYKAMLQAGLKVQGLMGAAPWQDLGDIKRYREAALAAGARKTFGKVFDDNAPFEVYELKGDGSERIWRRLRTPRHSMVVADHGLTPPADAGKNTEVEAFINIGRHLNAKGLPVAQIYFHDAFAGLVFTEDLGDTNLQAYVLNRRGREDVIKIYRRIIDDLVVFSQEGLKGFAPEWPWQTPSYDRELILHNECAYFSKRFVAEYLGIDPVEFALQAEFEHLAGQITALGRWGLMHRDLQSRNILLKDGKPYYIDYQGARRGPLQYDLASLLYDPYVMLDESTRNLLLNYCCSHVKFSEDSSQIREGFYYCALSRSMQALGAYAFLSRVKGKPWFQAYMQPALENLHTLLNGTHFQGQFMSLRALVTLCRQKLQQIT